MWIDGQVVDTALAFFVADDAQQITRGQVQRANLVVAAVVCVHRVIKLNVVMRVEARDQAEGLRNTQLRGHALLQAQPDNRQPAPVLQNEPHRDLFAPKGTRLELAADLDRGQGAPAPPTPHQVRASQDVEYGQDSILTQHSRNEQQRDQERNVFAHDGFSISCPGGPADLGEASTCSHRPPDLAASLSAIRSPFSNASGVSCSTSFSTLADVRPRSSASGRTMRRCARVAVTSALMSSGST